MKFFSNNLRETRKSSIRNGKNKTKKPPSIEVNYRGIHSNEK